MGPIHFVILNELLVSLSEEMLWKYKVDRRINFIPSLLFIKPQKGRRKVKKPKTKKQTIIADTTI